ncbi:hypothetical protein QR97_25330 [Streptomyces sp. PBH53]|nr:hypothetical protein QR97_25330 [Streptomyces sp. PBH53]
MPSKLRRKSAGPAFDRAATAVFRTATTARLPAMSRRATRTARRAIAVVRGRRAAVQAGRSARWWARTTASSTAWLPPWPRVGGMAWAASPRRTVRPRWKAGRGWARWWTPCRSTSSGRAAASTAGTGSCQSP